MKVKKIVSFCLAATLMFSATFFDGSVVSAQKTSSKNSTTLSGIIDISSQNVDEISVHNESTGMLKKVNCFKNFFEKKEINASLQATSYKSFGIQLNVTSGYKPSIKVLCKVSSSGNYWGIQSIENVTMNRSYNGVSYQFEGDIFCKLISPYQILWQVSGDFYENGSTSFGVSGSAGLGEVYEVSAEAAYESNWYAYFYDDGTISYQR